MAANQQPPSGGNRPFIAPGAPTVSPADAYALGARARQDARKAERRGPAGSLLPKADRPVAGGQGPAIPRFDQPFSPDQPLGVQEAARRAQAGRSRGVVELPTTDSRSSILSTDLLTPQAQADPSFMEGQGSMYAVNQPELARKYGVIRNGSFVPPQVLMPAPNANSRIRPETLKDMETLGQLMKQQSGENISGLHKTDEEAERAVRGTASEAAATTGNLPGDKSAKPLTEEDKKIKKAVEGMDEFDVDSFRQAMMHDILNNDEQRKLIEAKLEPLTFDEVLSTGRFTQKVPIIPGKFEVRFQSSSGDEDLALKRLILEEANSLEVSDRYFFDKYALMGTALGLKEINGRPYGPSYLDESGNFDDKKFRERLNVMLKLPLHMLASIGVNLYWFEIRVRKMFKAEKVGNG